MGISLDEAILDASTSSISISDGTDTLAINADGSLNATVTATQLDIDDLTFANDKVDASGSEVSLDAATLAALENVSAIVTATDLDIRDLTHASDSVKVGDGTDFLAINADGSIDVQQAKYAAMKHSQAAVTTTAAEVVATPLTGRQELTIQNEGSQPVYMGFDNSVTAANGIKISKNSSATYLIPEGVDVWMIAASGSQDVRFLELG
jgi:archaellum component FlaF (FlaF/FlaG flagellin family)